jgi:8-oxo-dGTP diphosphatase
MDKEKRDVVKTVACHTEKEKFLVVQRSAHDSMPLKWEFPGGGVEEDETVREAALRELEEETGLEGEIIRRGEPGKFEREEDILEFNVFEVEVSGSVELGDEHRDFLWVSKEKLEKLDSEDGMKKDLEAIDEWDTTASK